MKLLKGLEKRIYLIIILFFLFGCKPQNNIPPEQYCNSDSECAPASCCHANSCVSANQRPNCENIMCTMECKPGTMDCGQGKCVCQNYECIAEIN